jgi:hypothetical protein
MRLLAHVAALAAVSFLTACPVFGEEPVTPRASDDDFHLVGRLGLWGTAMSGDVGVKGLTVPADASFSDLFDNLNFGAFGGVDATKGNWAFSLNFMYSVLSDEVNVLDGRGKIDTSMNMAVIDMGIGYTIFNGRSTIGDMPISLTPAVGARWTFLSTELNPQNFDTLSDSIYWIDPYVGGRIVVGLTRALDWRTGGTVGGFGIGSQFAWLVESYLDWHFAENWELNIGYRCMSYDYEDGSDFVFDETLQGPWLGISYHFM